MVRVQTSIGMEVQGYSKQDLDVWTRWAEQVVVRMQDIDPDLVPDAQARVDRLKAGLVLDVDISGLQDWADTEGWTA